MKADYEIRQETEKDYPQVFKLVEEAFRDMEESDHREQFLVERLRHLPRICSGTFFGGRRGRRRGRLRPDDPCVDSFGNTGCGILGAGSRGRTAGQAIHGHRQRPDSGAACTGRPVGLQVGRCVGARRVLSPFRI